MWTEGHQTCWAAERQEARQTSAERGTDREDEGGREDSMTASSGTLCLICSPPCVIHEASVQG